MGPPNLHEGEKNAVEGWKWVGGQACMAMDFASLAGQTPAGPGGNVAGKSTPQELGWNNMKGGEPHEVSNIMKVRKLQWKRRQPGIGRLSSGKPIWVMCCPTSAVFLCSGYARRLSLLSPLDLPPLWWWLIQWLGGGGWGDKQSATTFFKPRDRKVVHWILK